MTSSGAGGIVLRFLRPSSCPRRPPPPRRRQRKGMGCQVQVHCLSSSLVSYTHGSTTGHPRVSSPNAPESHPVKPDRRSLRPPRHPDPDLHPRVQLLGVSSVGSSGEVTQRGRVTSPVLELADGPLRRRMDPGWTEDKSILSVDPYQKCAIYHPFFSFLLLIKYCELSI